MSTQKIDFLKELLQVELQSSYWGCTSNGCRVGALGKLKHIIISDSVSLMAEKLGVEWSTIMRELKAQLAEYGTSTEDTLVQVFSKVYDGYIPEWFKAKVGDKNYEQVMELYIVCGCYNEVEIDWTAEIYTKSLKSLYSTQYTEYMVNRALDEPDGFAGSCDQNCDIM
jgi:DNA-binding transcriptional ArsR family regulator